MMLGKGSTVGARDAEMAERAVDLGRSGADPYLLAQALGDRGFTLVAFDGDVERGEDLVRLKGAGEAYRDFKAGINCVLVCQYLGIVMARYNSFDQAARIWAGCQIWLNAKSLTMQKADIRMIEGEIAQARSQCPPGLWEV